MQLRSRLKTEKKWKLYSSFKEESIQIKAKNLLKYLFVIVPGCEIFIG